MREDLYAMTRDVCLSEDGIILDLFVRRAILGLLDRQVQIDDERLAKRLWILLMLALWDRYKL